MRSPARGHVSRSSPSLRSTSILSHLPALNRVFGRRRRRQLLPPHKTRGSSRRRGARRHPHRDAPTGRMRRARATASAPPGRRHPSALREARDVAVDLLLDRAREADQGERLRRADRAVEAVGALLQPAEGRVQREPQRTGGRGAWRGRVFEPRASAHRFSVPRLWVGARGYAGAARSASREAATWPSRIRRTGHRQLGTVTAGDFSCRAVEDSGPPRCPLTRWCPSTRAWGS